MSDAVNSPGHYHPGDYEVYKVLEAWGLDNSFYLGNVVKYVARCGHKGEAIEDLQKARWYLDRKIKVLEQVERESKPTHVYAEEKTDAE
jgi:hypothetical protein